MKEKWEIFKETLTEETVMSKKEFLLTLAVCILGGVVLGMFCSPRKSIVIGCGNGNNSCNGNESGKNCDKQKERKEKK